MESGTMVDDLETSNKYRSELIDFVRRCLGLAQAADDDAGSESDSGSSNTSSSDSSSCAVKDTAYGHIIQSFAMLGREIQDKYNVGK